MQLLSITHNTCMAVGTPGMVIARGAGCTLHGTCYLLGHTLLHAHSGPMCTHIMTELVLAACPRPPYSCLVIPAKYEPARVFSLSQPLPSPKPTEVTILWGQPHQPQHWGKFPSFPLLLSPCQPALTTLPQWPVAPVLNLSTSVGTMATMTSSISSPAIVPLPNNRHCQPDRNRGPYARWVIYGRCIMPTSANLRKRILNLEFVDHVRLAPRSMAV